MSTQIDSKTTVVDVREAIQASVNAGHLTHETVRESHQTKSCEAIRARMDFVFRPFDGTETMIRDAVQLLVAAWHRQAQADSRKMFEGETPEADAVKSLMRNHGLPENRARSYAQAPAGAKRGGYVAVMHDSGEVIAWGRSTLECSDKALATGLWANFGAKEGSTAPYFETAAGSIDSLGGWFPADFWDRPENKT